MFNLLPKDTVFFDLFEDLAATSSPRPSTCDSWRGIFPTSTADIQRIREEEHAADELAHQALDRLDRTFITPVRPRRHPRRWSASWTTSSTTSTRWPSGFRCIHVEDDGARLS